MKPEEVYNNYKDTFHIVFKLIQQIYSLMTEKEIKSG